LALNYCNVSQLHFILNFWTLPTLGLSHEASCSVPQVLKTYIFSQLQPIQNLGRMPRVHHALETNIATFL